MKVFGLKLVKKGKNVLVKDGKKTIDVIKNMSVKQAKEYLETKALEMGEV